MTPEGVDLGVVLGLASARVTAFAIDLTLMGLGLGLFGAVLLFLGSRTGNGYEAVFVITWILGAFFLRNGYFIAQEMSPRAASIGKRVMGLRVIARDGGRLSGDGIITRNLMREVEMFMPATLVSIVPFLAVLGGPSEMWAAQFALLWMGVFLLFPLFNRDRMRIGDLLGGTWVIAHPKRRLVADVDDALLTKDRARYGFTAEQLHVYGIRELDVLRRALTQPLARQIPVAESIAIKIGWTEPLEDIPGFLTAYYAALKAHLEGGLLYGRAKRDKYDQIQSRRL